MSRVYRFTLSILSLIGLCLVSGCATTEYGCKGMPDEPSCLSTTQAYQETNRALADVAVNPDHPVETTPASDLSPAVQQPVPKIDDPTPIRTPSQVMRIWIAPWEDAEGDLMVSNYVYTELEPRRWMIGKSAPSISPSLIPLQVEQRAQEKRPLADADDGESRTMQPTLNIPAAKN